MKDKSKTKAQLLEEMKLLRNLLNDMEVANINGNNAKESLIDSEVRYRRLFETAQDGILILNGNTGVIIDVNPFLIEMLGYPHGEFVGKRLWEIGPFKDIEASKIAYKELQRKNYIRYEHLPLETKDGRRISVEFVSNVYLVNHSRIIQCNIRDITQRKLEEEKSRTIIRTAMDGFWYLDNEGNFLDVNESYCRLIGYSHDELIKMSISDIECKETTEEMFRHLQRLKKIGFDSFITCHRCKDGKIIDIEVSVNYMNMEGGRLFVFLRDITERKKAEQALKVSETKYKVLFEALPLGVTISDKAGNIVESNREAEQLLGLSNEEQGKRQIDGQEWSIIKPDGSPMPADEYASVRALKENKRIENVEMGLVKGDDDITWINVTAAPIPLDNYGVAIAYTDITNRKIAEQQLHFQATVFSQIADAVIVIDNDSHIAYWNKGAENMYGLAKDIVIGYELDKVYHNKWLNPDEEHSFNRSLQNEGSWFGESIHIKKDGSKIYVRSSITRLKDKNDQIMGYLHIIRDITQFRLIHEALKQSEVNYKTLVDSSPDAIVLLDQQGNIIESNTALYNLLGYSREQILGKHITQYIRGMTSSVFKSLYKQIINQRIIEQELNISIPDGEVIPFWAKIIGIFDDDRQLIQTIMYLRSIEKQKKLEQLKDEFIGLVSHELRTPLTVIIGSLSTVLSEMSQLSQVEVEYLLKDAILEAENLSSLVGNFLELSRIQSKQLQLYIEPVNIRILVENIVAKLKKQNPLYQFGIHIPAEIQSIYADSTRIERILYNLLENAVKYSAPQSKVELTVKIENEQIIFGVTDHGKGIAAEEKAKLFGPFQRLDQDRIDGIKGIGLGLLVCQRLVEAHNGRIWLESKLGQGSTFFFTLPLLQELHD